MKIQKILFALVLVAFVTISCKNETTKNNTENNTELKEAKAETVALNISGMTCEIGCAKTIQSKLATKEGVLDAKVVFTDSIATVKYDANKTSKEDLIALVEGIGTGEMYKVTLNKGKKACATDCKMACCEQKEEKKACAADCKMACCEEGKTEKTAKTTACNLDANKECCATKKA